MKRAFTMAEVLITIGNNRGCSSYDNAHCNREISGT